MPRFDDPLGGIEESRPKDYIKGLSKDMEYLKTIKKHHKVATQFEALIPEAEWNRDVGTLNQYERAMQNCNRLNGVALIRPYNLALHCYYTTLLFQHYAVEEGVDLSKEEVAFVLRHDIFEVVTGDVLLPVKIHSADTKRKWEEIEEEVIMGHPKLFPFTDENAKLYFSEKSWKLFKACDLLELFQFCMEETRLGNHGRGIKAVITNCKNLIPEFGFVTITEYVEGT